MKITLTNGTELNAIIVIGSKKNLQGATRDTLSFLFPAETSLDELDAIFTAENCESISITGEDGLEYIHKGYTIRASLSREPVVVSPATESEEEIIENRVTVSMASRTSIESQMAEMQAALAALAGVEV